MREIRVVIQEYCEKLAEAVERLTVKRIAKEIAKTGRGRKKRGKVLCYAPGCKNTAAPRFGMVCVAKHKGASKADKLKWRTARQKKPMQVKRPVLKAVA